MLDKNKQKLRDKQRRATILDMNLGTRDMKSSKQYDRHREKRELKKEY